MFYYKFIFMVDYRLLLKINIYFIVKNYSKKKHKRSDRYYYNIIYRYTYNNIIKTTILLHYQITILQRCQLEYEQLKFTNQNIKSQLTTIQYTLVHYYSLNLWTMNLPK